MPISIGIVGLSNSGKSTLFNALAREKIAKTSVTPFTTVAHNEVTIDVPESDRERIGSDTIRFIDISGLVSGSSQGRGFGNAFLEKIRGVNLLIHIVRGYYSTMVSHPHMHHEPGSLQQVLEDIEVVNKELKVAGVTKPVIYVLNFDEYKLTSGVTSEYISQVRHKYGEHVVGLSAKLEEQLIDMSEEDRNNKLRELNITETGLEKIIKESCLLLGKNRIN